MTNTEIKIRLEKILFRNEQRKANKLIPADILDIKDIIKQLRIGGVVSSFPSNKELHSAYNDAVLKNHKTLDELNKEYIKLGFLYYHKYLQLKRMK